MNITMPETMKSFSLEKELLESQLRKLQIENTRLQNENDILQNKYKRAQSRITFLEEQILHNGQDVRDFSDSGSTSSDNIAQQQVLNLRNQLEQLKSQNATLERQLRGARLTSKSGLPTTDIGRIVDGFAQETAALKDELARAKDLLAEGERHHQMEMKKNQELASELKKLTELKTLLQQDVHGGGSGCVAEKQVRSLSERLRVTEDRLHYERADRAAKLSDVEEKLLRENARLQVAEKELVRQLTREKEKHRNMETKMKEYRDQVEKLQVTLSVKSNAVNNKQLRSGVASKKQKEDVNMIMDEIKRELNLGPGQEGEIIWLLWQANQDMSRQLKELELGLDVLKMDYGSISKGLKALREEKELYEERLERYKNIIDDLKNEKEDLNNIYKQQVKELTEEKHQNHIKAQNMGDLAAALSAENEALKSSLFSGSSSHVKTGHSIDEARLVTLRHDLQSTQSELSKQQRSTKLLQSQVESLKAQIAAKDQAFPAIMEALQRLGSEEVIKKTEAQLTYATKSSKIDQVDHTLSRLDQLQLDLQRKSRSLDHIHNLDAEQSLIIQTLQENLAAVNEELDKKNKQLKMKESYLDAEHKKVQQLEREVRARDDLLSDNIAKVLNEGKLTSPLVSYKRDAPKDRLSSIDAKTRLLEYERNTAQADVKRAQESMEKIAEENTELLGRLRNMRQDLVKERATVCQLTSDKVEAEQKLRLCIEERNSSLREKQRLEQRLARHEATTMKTVQRLEGEHQRIAEDHMHKYHTLDAEGKKLALELATAQRLLEAREKEIELLKTDVEHKSQEISNLERRLTIVREEHQATREEMDNLSKQLTYKTKEEASATEVNSSLSNEKLRLELEKAQLQKEHERQRQELDHKKRDLEDLFRKHEKTEAALKQAEAQLHQKETKIVGLEMEMKHADNKIAMLEEERNDLKREVAELRSEILTLNTDITSLQNELHEHKSSLSEEKMNQGQILEKLSNTSHQAELVKRDYDVLNANLDHERTTIRNLRDSLKMEEDKNLQFEVKLTALKHELENANRQLAENKSISDQYKKEKQVLYQDVQDLCSKLSEKDNMIAELQDKCDSTVENIHKDLTSEKSLIQQQREKLAQELSQTRQELEEAKDKLRHKDLQLQAYVHTNRHLEQETMHRQEAEKALDKAEDELLQNKRQVSQLTIENKRLMDENSHQLEMIDKLERNIAQLKDQVRQQREELMAERQELQHGHSKDLSELHSHQTDLEEKLSRVRVPTLQAQMELKSTKSTLASALEAKDNLHAEKQNYERTVQKLKAQLSEESAAKKIADQQLQEKMSQIAELKSQKRDLDDQLANIQIQLIKSETEHKAEKDRQKKLKQDLTAAKSSSTSNEAHVQALYLRISELEGELMSLTSQAETTRQNLEGKNKRLALELKQLIETQDKERAKLIQQAQQLSADLEAARETSAEKSRENLSLQEDLMNGESKIRDLSTDLKRMSDELKNERDQRQNLEQKNHSLQMNLLKIRPQGEGDDPSSESARLEVNKMMTDLSRSMTQQLEAQKSADKESRSKDLKSFEDFKKKIAQLESSLSQEQGMHTITKTQLDAVNEDNTRLRHQLQVARKKLHGVSIEERSRSRIDDINELINRSQSRAQQMLASGMYAGANSPHSVADPLHIVTASRDFGAFSPAPVMMMTSPLSRSMMSDEILRASSPHDPGQK